jgi:dihydrofolate reductase
MQTSLIVAASENGVIGRDNAIPWHLPDDLAFFRQTTEGHPIIMGRKNHESIGKALPNRQNIVITRQKDYKAEGCDVVGSLEEALTMAKRDDTDEIFVIGGGEVYKQALSFADRVYLTRVHAEIEGDVFFPDLDDGWVEVARERHESDEKHAYAFTILTFDRRPL